MTNPAPRNTPSCVYDVLNHALDTIPTDEARWSLRIDAECQRDALLDALAFIGTAMQDSTATSTPHPFSQADLNHLSGFLMCAPNLIRGMNSVIEAYEEPAADRQEVRHV